MMVRFTAGMAGLVIAAGLAAPAPAAGDDWRAVADALGKAGAETPGGVYRIGLPRTDLKVMFDGVELKPALALGTWLIRTYGHVRPEFEPFRERVRRQINN